MRVDLQFEVTFSYLSYPEFHSAHWLLINRIDQYKVWLLPVN